MSVSHSAQQLTSVLRSAWRRPKARLVRVPKDATKIYERTPPVWARWALVLVSVDVMVATSSVDIIWNAWTMPDPALQQEQDAQVTKNSAPTQAIKDASEKKPNMFQIIPPGHVLVPAWKRAVSCSMFVVTGIAVAGSILAARSRIVRTISYVRASKETPGVPPGIYLQTASHPMKFGNAFPVNGCSLLPSSQDQMLLQIKDHGKWVLDMRGANIGGQPAPEDKVLSRSIMLKTWKAIDGSTQRPQ